MPFDSHIVPDYKVMIHGVKEGDTAGAYARLKAIKEEELLLIGSKNH